MELDDFLVSDENGPYQEYFYLELPSRERAEGGSSHSDPHQLRQRRFIFIRKEVHLKFPMSFGSEVSVSSDFCSCSLSHAHDLLARAGGGDADQPAGARFLEELSGLGGRGNPSRRAIPYRLLSFRLHPLLDDQVRWLVPLEIVDSLSFLFLSII